MYVKTLNNHTKNMENLKLFSTPWNPYKHIFKNCKKVVLPYWFPKNDLVVTKYLMTKKSKRNTGQFLVTTWCTETSNHNYWIVCMKKICILLSNNFFYCLTDQLAVLKVQIVQQKTFEIKKSSSGINKSSSGIKFFFSWCI